MLEDGWPDATTSTAVCGSENEEKLQVRAHVHETNYKNWPNLLNN